MKTSGSAELVGVLDIGDDVGGFPQRAGLDRPQADRPVAAPRGPGRGYDVELDLAAQRMTLERKGDAGLDLVQRGRRLRKNRLEVHQPSPVTKNLQGDVWGRVVNGGLSLPADGAYLFSTTRLCAARPK